MLKAPRKKQRHTREHVLEVNKRHATRDGFEKSRGKRHDYEDYTNRRKMRAKDKETIDGEELVDLT